MSDRARDYETVDPATRKRVLTRDGHRCQICGRGESASSDTALHVHHIERDPDGFNEHDLENLLTLCRQCHSWIHQQPAEDETPFEITDADEAELLPQDYEILRILADNGPLSTGDIKDELSLQLSITAVRDRLWTLMGLDNLVETREQQVVDKDLDTGHWGLVGQIETSARRHVPDDSKVLLQRIQDEQARQALERGCSRETVADVLGVSERSLYRYEKRAAAYDFPLDAFSGQDSHSDAADSAGEDETVTAGAAARPADGQQAVTAVADGAGESPEDSTDDESDESGQPAASNDVGAARQQLRTAIEALQEVKQEL